MRRLMGLIVVLFSVSLVAAWLLGRGPSIPDSSILVLEIAGNFVEEPPADALSRLLAPGPSLASLLLQLDKARVDDRVAGVLLHSSSSRTASTEAASAAAASYSARTNVSKKIKDASYLRTNFSTARQKRREER